MRSKAIRARDITTDHQIVIHDAKKRDTRHKICEVYKNKHVVQITYRNPDDEGSAFGHINAKPMHRVRVAA
jgi:hypothetical protein